MKEGEAYSRSSTVEIHGTIQRHLTGGEFQRIINLVSGPNFKSVNDVLSGTLKEMKKEGLDHSNRIHPLMTLIFPSCIQPALCLMLILLAYSTKYSLNCAYILGEVVGRACVNLRKISWYFLWMKLVLNMLHSVLTLARRIIRE